MPDTSSEVVLFRELDGHQIGQREGDGYVNATALCRAAGKRWNDYARLDSTTAFVKELEAVTGIPATELLQVRQGGTPSEQGSWVHPDCAVNLAQWLSPRFAVLVSRWVRELLTRGRVELAQTSGDALLDSVVALQRRDHRSRRDAAAATRPGAGAGGNPHAGRTGEPPRDGGPRPGPEQPRADAGDRVHPADRDGADRVPGFDSRPGAEPALPRARDRHRAEPPRAVRVRELVPAEPSEGVLRSRRRRR